MAKFPGYDDFLVIGRAGVEGFYWNDENFDT